eukprot:Sspe_Gene.29353::Locus_13890_Transcript_1_4_Confidence_0.333_Length_8046::g.29353::m.29353
MGEVPWRLRAVGWVLLLAVLRAEAAVTVSNGGTTDTSVVVTVNFAALMDGTNVACTAIRSGGSLPSNYAGITALTHTKGTSAANSATITLNADSTNNGITPSTSYTVQCGSEMDTEGVGSLTLSTLATATLTISNAATNSKKIGVTVSVNSRIPDGKVVACVAYKTIGGSFGNTYALINANANKQVATIASGSGTVADITADSDGTAIAGKTSYTVKCRDQDDAVPTASTLVLSTLADCSFDSLKAVVGGTTYTGGDILTTGGMTATASAVTSTCAAAGTVVHTEGCTLSKTGYNDAQPTCNDGQWSAAELTGKPCTPINIPNSNFATMTVTGVTDDKVTIVCNSDFTCSVTPCTVTCGTDGTFGTPPVCNKNCAVPVISGATVTGCTEGGSVTHNTVCTWTQAPGYSCSSGTGPQTCAGGTLVTPTCTENTCNNWQWSNVAGAKDGATNGCPDGVRLTAVTKSTCTLECNEALGYQAAVGSLTCPLSGGNPTTTLKCDPVKCTATFNHDQNGVLKPASTTACDDVTKGSCALTCNSNGYINNGAGPPELKCVNAGGTGRWEVLNPCNGPATCGTYKCPQGYILADSPSLIFCSAVSAGGVCTVGDTGNNARCCPAAAACPLHASGAGVCNCDDGYTGTPTWASTSWSHDCKEVTCPPIRLSTGHAPGASDGCTDGLVLSAHSDSTCNMQCKPGYAANGAKVSCTLKGTLVTDPDPFTCSENTCSAYTFPKGVVAGDSGTPCSDKVVLQPVTSPSCSVKCAPGYSGGSGFVTCGTTQSAGAVPLTNLTCTENLCAPYNFSAGVTGGLSNGCTDGIQLGTSTVNSCTLRCKEGYSGAATTLRCSTAAANGDPPTGSITCTPTCGLHTCGKGHVPKTTPQSIVCNTGCTDTLCCDVVKCPDNSGPQGVCNCSAGWSGTAKWDGSSKSWIHSCTPTCANPGFAGCPSGQSLVANASTTTCVGGDSCTVTSCPRCKATDCCTQNTCLPFTPPAGYVISGSVNCTTTAECGTVTCATGFKGTASLACDVAGSNFVVSGCSAAECPPHASGAGTCNCDPGYTGSPEWDSTGQWKHTCTATCAHPSFAGCQGGLILKLTPEGIKCTGTADDPAKDCTAAVCCDASCDNSGFTGCSAAGLLLKGNASSLHCSGSSPTDCSIATCCDASCANTAFTKCSTAGLQPKPNPNTLHCPTSDPASCTVAGCCDATDCTQYQCTLGSHHIPGRSSCSGVCTEPFCCQENECTPPPASIISHNFTNRAGCTKLSTCGGVTCSDGYSGTAVVTCPQNGGPIKAEGCVENQCTLPLSSPYVVSGPSNCTRVSECGTINCVPGYHGASPMLRCPVNNTVFVGSGCTENRCTASAALLRAYTLQNPNCTTVGQCGAVGCAPGYIGTSANLSCPTHLGDFVGVGCVPNTCAPPTVPTGYVVQNPSCTTVGECGAVSCGKGFNTTGTPRVVCNASRVFSFEGCTALPCPANASGPGVCACNKGYVGTPTFVHPSWTHTCQPVACPPHASGAGECTCNPGYTGSPQWDTSTLSWVGTCQEKPCPANASGPGNCSCVAGYHGLPSWSGTEWTHKCLENMCPTMGRTAGYVVTGGTTCTTVTQCGSVSCAQFFDTTGTPSLTCPVNGGEAVGSGCTGRPCPGNASPPGVCTCNKGYVGTPRFDPITNAFNHTCTVKPCPANSSGDGVCACDSGFMGIPTWDGLQWTHTCTVATCPANADPQQGCRCLRGFKGTPQWNTTHWVHNCTAVACPEHAEGAGCVCKMGYTGPPQWDAAAMAWTHTCTVSPCPANSSGSGCPCNPGFLGSALWQGGQWVHNCTAVDCPEHSSPAGDCTCNNGYTGQPSWTGSSWAHSCTVVACPIGASPPGVCTCGSGLTGSPAWDGTKWVHNCADPSVPCPANATGAGICECNRGFSGTAFWNGTHWTHSCTVAPCPDNASGIGSCTCNAGFRGVPVWVGGQWTHSCVPGECKDTNATFCASQLAKCQTDAAVRDACCLTCQNTSTGPNLPPVASMSTTMLSVSEKVLTYTNPTFLTGVAGPELGQAVTATCEAAQKDLFTDVGQPGITIQGTNGVLAFDPVQNVSVAKAGTTSVTCVLTDSGVPARSLTITFSVTLFDENDPPCGGVCNLATSVVSASATQGAVQLAGFVKNLNPGPAAESGQTVAVTCTPADGTIATNIAIDTSGTLTLIPGRVGSTEVTCTATDNGQPEPAATTFKFTVTTTAVSRRWLRMVLRMSIARFTKTTFIEAVRRAIRQVTVLAVQVFYVCPSSACQGDVCPLTDQLRRAAGCIPGSGFTSSRALAVLQDDRILVDFDITTANAPGTAEKERDQQLAIADLASDAQNCAAGTPCELGEVMPANAQVTTSTPTTDFVVLETPAPTMGRDTTGSDEDDGLTDTEIAIIVICCILGCLLLLLLLFCCMKKKKKGKQQGKGGDAEKGYGGGYGDGYSPDNTAGGDKYRGNPMREKEMGVVPGTTTDGYAQQSSYPTYYDKSATGDDYYSYDPSGRYGQSYDYTTASGTSTTGVTGDEYSYEEGSGYGRGAPFEFDQDEVVSAQYLDGQYYEGTIWSKAPDGTYSIRWYDGSHSEGVPPEQIRRPQR